MTIAYNHRGGHGVCYTVLAVSVTKTSRSLSELLPRMMGGGPTRCVRGEAHDVANSGLGGGGEAARPSLLATGLPPDGRTGDRGDGRGRLVPSTSRVLRKFAPRDLIS